MHIFNNEWTCSKGYYSLYISIWNIQKHCQLIQKLWKCWKRAIFVVWQTLKRANTAQDATFTSFLLCFLLEKISNFQVITWQKAHETLLFCIIHLSNFLIFLCEYCTCLKMIIFLHVHHLLVFPQKKKDKKRTKIEWEKERHIPPRLSTKCRI